MCCNYQCWGQVRRPFVIVPPRKQQPTNVRTFNPDEREQSLSIPTAQIIERHDYRTILHFFNDEVAYSVRPGLDEENASSPSGRYYTRHSSHHLRPSSYSISFLFRA